MNVYYRFILKIVVMYKSMIMYIFNKYHSYKWCIMYIYLYLYIVLQTRTLCDAHMQ